MIISCNFEKIEMSISRNFESKKQAFRVKFKSTFAGWSEQLDWEEAGLQTRPRKDLELLLLSDKCAITEMSPDAALQTEGKSRFQLRWELRKEGPWVDLSAYMLHGQCMDKFM